MTFMVLGISLKSESSLTTKHSNVGRTLDLRCKGRAPSEIFNGDLGDETRLTRQSVSTRSPGDSGFTVV